jgi:hypothetical protein
MAKFRTRKRTRRGRSRYLDAVTAEGQEAQRLAAFAAIRRLYCESLPLWRTCARGYCRRHHACGGDGAVCLKRTWPLMSPQLQQQAYELVRRGGPRGVHSATRREWILRGYPPSNFVL